MSLEKVKKYFEQYGMEEKILEFDVSSETVELASIAVGCEGKQITKTMSFCLMINLSLWQWREMPGCQIQSSRKSLK